MSSNNLSSNFCVILNLGPILCKLNSLLERDFVWSVTRDVVEGVLLDMRLLCFLLKSAWRILYQYDFL